MTPTREQDNALVPGERKPGEIDGLPSDSGQPVQEQVANPAEGSTIESAGKGGRGAWPS